MKTKQVKRILSVTLVMAIMFSIAIPVCAAESSYQIYDAQDLYNIRNDLDAEYYLMNDIDISCYENWTPIDDFTGTFDGQNHTITGLKINSQITNTDETKYYCIGLFAYMEGTVKNVGISGSITVDINKDSFIDAAVGGLMGTNLCGTVENCYSTVDVKLTAVSAKSYTVACVGSLMGTNNEALVNNCYATGDVTVDMQSLASDKVSDGIAGGLVGNNPDSAIINSYATGNVSSTVKSVEGHANNHVGGLVGNSLDSKVVGCYATGNAEAYSDGVLSSYAVIGGLAGDVTGTLSNSYANGNVIAKSVANGTDGQSNLDAGGLAGRLYSGDIENCYATGDVTANGESKEKDAYVRAGGLVGTGTSISRSYATGNVAGEASGVTYGIAYIDAISGTANGLLLACYYNTDTTDAECDYATGLSTTEMKKASSYKAFFFDIVWGIDEAINNGYPYLLKQEVNFPVERITLDTEYVEIIQDETLSLKASFTPSYAINKKLVWTSSDPTVATVENGVVTGVSGGEAVITAISVDNEDASAYCRVVVKEKKYISTAADLDNIRNEPNGIYYLNNDIDLSDIENWITIEEFGGVLDGQGHKITGFNVDITVDNAEDTEYADFEAGLFNFTLSTAEIRNLSIEGNINVNINRGGASFVCVGSLVASNMGLIENCSAAVDMNVVVKSILDMPNVVAGGIAGNHDMEAIVVNCSSSGNIEATLLSKDMGAHGVVGGLFGFCMRSVIENCYATGTVTLSCNGALDVNGNVGGLIGNLQECSVVNSYATGDVWAEFTSGTNNARGYVGGLFGDGMAFDEESGINVIENCYAQGDVEVTAEGSGANVYTGGFAGSVYKMTVTDSCASGNVTASAVDKGVVARNHSGGFIGATSGAFIFNSYATGKVDIKTIATGTAMAENVLGGFIGDNSDTVVKKCYAKGDVTSVCEAELTALTNAGGFAGITSHKTVENSFATGNVDVNISGESAEISQGGFYGAIYTNETINCYSNGRVTNSGEGIARSFVNGFAGFSSLDCIAENCYYNNDNAKAEDAYAKPLTDEEMRTASCFDGFDFFDVWEINPEFNGGYPCHIAEHFIAEQPVITLDAVDATLRFDGTYETQAAKALVAFYNGGRLVLMGVVDIEIKAGEVHIHIPLEVKEYDEYKLMVWKDAGDINPLTPTI